MVVPLYDKGNKTVEALPIYMPLVPFYSTAPQHDPIREEIEAGIRRVLDRQWFVLGSAVTQFEGEFARFCQTPHCVGVGNGMDALELASRAMGIGPGDEVLVPAHTFAACWMAVSAVGAKPVGVDVDGETGLMTATLAALKLTRSTKAIMPVHLYGQACNMQEISELTRENNLLLLEDAAQAHGAAWQGRPVGSWGDMAAFSFYPTKNLGALGDAGCIVTSSDDYAERLRSLRNYGSSQKYRHEELGRNSRLDELQAAVLSVKLAYLEKWNRERQEIAHLYSTHLQGVGDLILPTVRQGTTHVFHLYVIRTAHRDQLAQHLSDRGIGTLIHYPTPPHLQPAFQYLGHQVGDFPNAEAFCQTALSLPLYPGLSLEQIEWVTKAVRAFF